MTPVASISLPLGSDTHYFVFTVWFGLVNQISYTFAMTATMLPFRDLLKPSTPFQWSDQLTEAIATSKQYICESIRAGVLDSGSHRNTANARPTILSAAEMAGTSPWSDRDLLMRQNLDTPRWRGALAVADAPDRARHFVLGCRDLTVAVDHKPLLMLFGDRCLEDIPNPCLRNLKEKTFRYLFRTGTGNLTSDALSRHPSGTRTPTRLHLPDDPDDDGLATAICAPPLSTGNSFRQQPRQTSPSRTKCWS